MAVADPASQADGAYAALFRHYIQRGAQAALTSVQSAGPTLPAEAQEQSLHALEFALELPDAWPEARALLLVLAPKLEQAGYRQGAVPFLQRGIAQCQAAGDLTGQAEMELDLGILYLAMGRLEAARDLFQASARRFAAAGQRPSVARALNRWAYCDRLQQRWGSAVDLVQQAMSLVTPDAAEWSYGQFVLGCVAVDRGDWPEALLEFEAALAGWQRHDDPVMSARSLTNLGTAQRGAGQIDAAIASFTEAIDLMGALGDTVNQAATRLNLGNAYWALGQPQQALEQYKLAEPVFRQTQDDLRLARVTLNMGAVYLQLERWPQAEEALTAAVAMNRAVGDRRGVANALDGLAELALHRGRPGEAEASLHAALAELAGLEAQPSYALLLSHIAGHLEEAQRAMREA